MHKTLFHIIFILFGSALFGSETNIALFNNAVSAYKSNHFEKAILENEKLLNSGCQTSTIYYNLGNAYFKQGNIGKAILNYERAERLSPDDEDIVHNLTFARLKTIDKVDPAKSFGLNALLKNSLSVLSSTAWAWLSIVLLWVGLALSIILLFQLNKKGLVLFGLVCSLLFAAVFFLLSRKQFSFENKCNTAIIMQAQSYIKSAPDDSSTDLFQLHEGTAVEILDKVDNYWKIKIADGRVGWILKEEATKI